jgi:predicted nucleic acid-binding protein
LLACPQKGYFVAIDYRHSVKYLVDANVLSEATKPDPDPGVIEWLRRRGQPMSIKDSLIAASALAHDLALATLNQRDSSQHE